MRRIMRRGSGLPRNEAGVHHLIQPITWFTRSPVRRGGRCSGCWLRASGAGSAISHRWRGSRAVRRKGKCPSVVRSPFDCRRGAWHPRVAGAWLCAAFKENAAECWSTTATSGSTPSGRLWKHWTPGARRPPKPRRRRRPRSSEVVGGFGLAHRSQGRPVNEPLRGGSAQSIDTGARRPRK